MSTKRRTSAFGTIVQESLDGTFLSDDEKRLNKVQTTLAKFDDGDGMIDAGEMGRALQAMGFSSLRAAFEVLFGVGANDVFPVRDRIRMWQTTKGMMKDTFDSLMANRQYEACKVMKSRMDVFDQQFESMHTEDTGRHRVAEEKNFHKACRIVRTKAETAYTKTQTKVADFAERKVAELAEVQSRDIQELDIRVSKFPCPSRLSTTQMLALKASERNLAQRGKFEEAGVMRKAVNVLQAPERAAFMDEEAKRIAAMKSVLRKSHEREKETLRRHLVDKEMGNTRTYERDVRDRNEKAITFLRRDMNHAQTLDGMSQAQKTFRPLISKRPNHRLTSASNGGSNFLRKRVGGATGGQIPVMSLTPLHDFEDMPSDTIEIPSYRASYK